jgi:O-antigen/teichoic acid export membrane protein
MMQGEKPTSIPRHIPVALLAGNTLFNVAGQALPLLVGIPTIPYVVHGIGLERFGILSFAWVLLGYFGLFDLGLGRATTKFVAECLGRDELHLLPELVWTSVGFQLVVGAVGGALVAVAVPAVVGRFLTVSPQYLSETELSFYILALSLPVVLVSAAFRAVLESSQRFDLINYVKVPANTSIFLLPAMGLALGFGLPGIVALLVLSRVATAVVYLVLCLKVFPNLGERFRFDAARLRSLLAYGGWVTVSNVISAFLASGDRFVIGALASMSAVSYYTAPSEMVGRLTIFPASLVLTLFPAFSSLEAQGARERLENLHARAIKFLLLTLGPLLALLIVLAPEILRLWLGADFAAQSTLVLQILAVGVLVNSLACLPLALIQGLGRPDVAAKFHIFELPVYAILLWFLIQRMGIAGAALAWSFRVALDALLLFGASWRLQFASLRSLVENGILRSLAAVLLLAAALALVTKDEMLLLTKVALCATLLLPFALGSWRLVLDDADRGFLAGSFGRVLAAFRS